MVAQGFFKKACTPLLFELATVWSQTESPETLEVVKLAAVWSQTESSEMLEVVILLAAAPASNGK